MTDKYCAEGHKRDLNIVDIPAAGPEKAFRAWECNHCGELVQEYDVIFPFRDHDCPQRNEYLRLLPTEEEMPEEVRRKLQWYLDDGTVLEVDVRFFSKIDWDRSEAWSEVWQGGWIYRGTEVRNPWRKCHTADYWAWYKKQESDDEK